MTLVSTTVHVETDDNRCGDLWCQWRKGHPFDDWELRCKLAAIYGIEPRFYISLDGKAVLPCGARGNETVFFGGARFSENNGILGDFGGGEALLGSVIASGAEFSLINWCRDPFPLLSPAARAFDVPYNQYWILESDLVMEAILARVDASAGREMEYILRKFSFEIVVPGRWDEAWSTLTDMFSRTSQVFSDRGRTFALDEALNRSAAEAVCSDAFRSGCLVFIEVGYRGGLAGLCVMIDDPRNSEAIYLLNLCGSTPSKVSNAVAIAPIVYAARTGRRVNGLRGAFTVKKKYGYRPEASYALVRSEAWQIKPQTDLSAQELHALYARPFGCEPPPG
ncbi:MAG: hypothetical protein ACT4N2_02570 [Hyphomicrobium sp.]